MKLMFPVIFIVIFVMSCTSCSENQNHDSDHDSHNDKDLHDFDINESDSVNDADLLDDDKPEEIPDIDEDTYCLPLKEAGFPYSRNDGSIHFCRECDTPTETDPDCVSNLWKEPNSVLCKEHPDLDCCGYPCTMDDLTPFYSDEVAEEYPTIYLDKCDIMLNANNPKGWQTGMATFKHYNLSDGKVGMPLGNVLPYADGYKTVIFDIASKKYEMVGFNSSNNNISYYNGGLFFGADSSHVNNFLVAQDYIIFRDSNGKYETAFNEPVRFVNGNPIINDKWAFMTVEIKNGDPYKMMYAKIGEWNWTVIGEDDTGGKPNLVGDKLTFYDQSYKAYVCDLSKNPKSRDDCIKLNREGEKIATPMIDRENENLIYYENIDTSDDNKIGRVDISKTPFEYEEMEIPGLSANTRTLPIQQVKGDLVLVTNIFNPSEGEDGDPSGDARVCYYSVSKKKSYCAQAVEHKDGIMAYKMAFAEFEDHWLIWQDRQQPVMKLRDMECYCDYHPEICPFNDYTPQPDNPKDPKTGKRPSDEPKK